MFYKPKKQTVPDFSHPLEDGDQYMPIPTDNRKTCTDCPFLLLFIVYLGGMIVISYSASPSAFSIFSLSRHERLYRPVDYLGRVCGVNNQNVVDGILSLPNSAVCKKYGSTSQECIKEVKSANIKEDLTDRPYLYYMDIARPFKYGGICVSYCPGSVLSNEVVKNNNKIHDSISSKKYCPPELSDGTGEIVSQFTNLCLTKRIDIESKLFPTSTASRLAMNNLKYKSLLYRCIPLIGKTNDVSTNNDGSNNNDNTNATNSRETLSSNTTIIMYKQEEIMSYLNSGEMVLNQLWGDVVKCWKPIILSFILSIVMALSFLIFIRLFAGFFVWLSIAMGFISLFMAGTVSIFEYISSLIFSYDEEDGEQIVADVLPTSLFYWMPNARIALAVICFVCSIIYVIFIGAYFRRIKRAVGIFKQAAQAVAAMPHLIVLPFFLFIVICIFMIFWLQTCLTLWSSVGYTYIDQFSTQTKWSNVHRFMFLYHLFGLFWVMEFFIAYLYTSVAGAIATWYWTPPDQKHLLLMNNPVAQAAARPLVFHMGSLALGSLIVGSIRFVSFIIGWLISRFKRLAGRNMFIRLPKFLAWCIKCLMMAIVKIVEVVSKHSYIQIAMYGKDFFTSSKNALLIIKRNASQIAVVDYMGNVILFMTQLAVCLTTTYVSSVLLTSKYLVSFEHDKELAKSSRLFVLGIIMVISFTVARVFTVIYETAIDTILQCYLMDFEFARNSDRPLHVESMRKIIEENKKTNIEEGEDPHL